MNINASPIEISIAGILISLFAVKTFLFFGIADRKNFLSWFHFSIQEIYNSPGRRIQKAKKNQNRFTSAIICFLFFAAGIYVLSN
jgi:hypothetical protein